MKILPDIIVSHAISFCNKVKDSKEKTVSEQTIINGFVLDFLYSMDNVILSISNKDSQILAITFNINSSENTIKELLNSSINNREDILINQIYNLNELKNS